MAKIENQVNYTITAKNQASGAFASLGAQIKALKGQIGEESTFGSLGKILAGTGAVAGLALVGRGLESATSKAADLAEQFERGEISLQNMSAELLKSLPILGNFAKAGENLSRALNAGLDSDANRLQSARDNIGNVRIGFAGSVGDAKTQASKIMADMQRDFVRKNGNAFQRAGQDAADANSAGAGQLKGFDDRISKVWADTRAAIGQLEAIAATTGDYARIDAAKLEAERAVKQIQVERAKVQGEIAKAGMERAKDLFSTLAGAGGAFGGIFGKIQEKAREDAAAAVRANIEALGERKGALTESMGNLRPSTLRVGATAESFTDVGASALLLARGQVAGDSGEKATRERMERDTKDIAKEAKEQTKLLKGILGKREGTQEFLQSIF